MIDALMMLGITAPPVPIGARRVSHLTSEDTEPPVSTALTTPEIDSAIEQILRRGDPRTPSGMAQEIGIAVARCARRIKAIKARDSRVHYRSDGVAVAWWRDGDGSGSL